MQRFHRDRLSASQRPILWEENDEHEIAAQTDVALYEVMVKRSQTNTSENMESFIISPLFITGFSAFSLPIGDVDNQRTEQ